MPRQPTIAATSQPRKPGRPPSAPPVPMKLVRALIAAGDQRARSIFAWQNAAEKYGLNPNLRNQSAFEKARDAAGFARCRWDDACAAILKGGV